MIKKEIEIAEILEDKFNGFRLVPRDYEDIKEIFKIYVAIVQRKVGHEISDEQIQGIVDTIHFSIRNILNFVNREIGIGK